ncbi:MAG: IS256 family transposase [Chloroflexi bacterium]|nr:IS256 family transposase [Chloroflexota bacterium]
MAEEKMALLDVLRKGEEPGGDVLVEGLRWLLQELMDVEVSAQIGAGRYERSGERTTPRNGYRSRPWDTRLGTLELAIPKLRQGSYFPSWLEPRRRAEQALVAVVAEAYVQGVSTRKVEALVQSLGIAGLSKSEVSRWCAVLNEQAQIFRTRPLDAIYPYIWLDARYEHVREGGRAVSMAVIVAYGVRADGMREVLGIDVGPSEDVLVWRTFLQSLVARGVRGVKLVTTDAHPGMKQAIAEVFVGAAWMRCRVHFMRNVLARVSKSAQAMVAATVRTIFEQADRMAAAAQLRHVCDLLSTRFPAVVQLLEEAEGEILTFYDFPLEHRRQVYSTNPLERLNKELKRRSAVVGIFPNRESVLRLFCALLAEQNDEWLVCQHRYFSEASMAKILYPKEEPAAPLPPEAAAA